jgi:PmbA protein
MDLNKTGKEILDKTRALHVDGAEVYLLSSRSTTIEVKKQKIDAFVEASSRGVGLRVIQGNRLGFASATLSDGTEIPTLIESALSSSNYTEADPCNLLPDKASTLKDELKIFDPSLQSVREEEKIEQAMALERAALNTDDRIKVVRKAGYSDSEYRLHLFNSNGADLYYKGTSCSASIMLMADDGKDQQMGWDADSIRSYSGLNVEAIGEKAAQNALALLNARTAPTIKCPVLFTPYAAVNFLEVFISSFSADSVQKGKSLLKGKTGESVASEAFTLTDDGLLAGGLGTAPFDDEGVPTSRKNLIQDGRLKGFLYDVYSAAKEGVSSTGNGVRGGYGSTPHVGPTNLYVVKGQLSRDQIIEKMGTGLEIMEIMGMHTANPISGDFSVGVSGLWIENGKPSHPVRGGAIAGNFIDLLKKVDTIGGDLRFYGAVGSPSLLISDLSVSGE